MQNPARKHFEKTNTSSASLQSFKAICFVIGEKPSRKHFENTNNIILMHVVLINPIRTTDLCLPCVLLYAPLCPHEHCRLCFLCLLMGLLDVRFLFLKIPFFGVWFCVLPEPEVEVSSSVRLFLVFFCPVCLFFK